MNIFYNLKDFFRKIWQFICEYHYQIVAIAAIASLLLMYRGIVVNRTSTDLNTRPYVSINMKTPIKRLSGKDVFYGNDIVFINKGRIPAADVSTTYYITTDKDKVNMHGVEWFNKKLGGYGSVSFITPDTVEYEPGLRSLSLSATYYYFEAVTDYEGLENGKRYWTHIKKVFYVDSNTGNLYPVYTHGEWDRNRNFSPPVISTEEEVNNLFQELNAVRTEYRQKKKP